MTIMNDVPPPPPRKDEGKIEMIKLNILVPRSMRDSLKGYALANYSTLTAAVVQALQEYADRRGIDTEPNEQ